MKAPLRVYGLLLRLLPGDFRARYGAEMRRMFEEQWREGSAFGRLRLMARTLLDVTFTAVHVRVFADEYGRGLGESGRRGASGGLSQAVLDARLAMRLLRRRPYFAATAAATLALGIGATVAVFSVVDATVLRALRIPDADRVVSVWSTFLDQGSAEFALSPAEFTDVREDVRAFAAVGGAGTSQATLETRAGGAARTIDLAFTAGDIYTIVGARAALGRLPGDEDDRPGASPVAVLSHGLWTEAYGGDASVVGTTMIRVGSAEALIIGVLTPDTYLPGRDADVWVHWVLDPASWASDRSGHSLETLARLAPGATLAWARAELAALEQTWAERYAGQHTIGSSGHAVAVMTLADRLLGGTRRIGWLLAAASVLLLGLACANVANLLLARGETRASEVGIRLALGASRPAVGRPVVMEGLLLGVCGGVIGLVLASAGLPLLLRAAPAGITGLDAVRMDIRVATFAVMVSLLSGLLFSLAPALSAARRDPAVLLRASGRGRTAAGRGLRALVASQTALATLLLAMAGLVTRSLLQLNALDPGFDTNARVSVQLTLPPEHYADAASTVAFYDAVRERLTALPGVRGAAFVRTMPLRDPQRNEYLLREGDAAPEGRRGVVVQLATPGWLSALGIPLVEGRDITAADRADGARVVLLNRTAARTLWPGESAVGKRIRPTFAPEAWGMATVVGVFEDVSGGGLTDPAFSQVVLPFAQMPGWPGWLRTARLVVHGEGAPAAVVDAVRRVVRDLDGAVPVESPLTLAAIVRESTARERFIVLLLQVFAGLALAIAAVGVSGVVSFTVARQARELAIRNVLGARPSTLVGGVLRSTLLMSGAGAVVGTVLVLLVAPLLSGFLYGVAPRDALVLVSVPLMLVAVALVASMVPAIRAGEVAPGTLLQE